VCDQADVRATHEQLSRLQTGRAGIYKNAGSTRDEVIRLGGDRFLFGVVALLAFIEGNFCAGIQGIKDAAMHSDQIARPLEFAQITAKGGWRDLEKLLKFRKA
jgi:hypothetical protein